MPEGKWIHSSWRLHDLYFMNRDFNDYEQACARHYDCRAGVWRLVHPHSIFPGAPDVRCHYSKSSSATQAEASNVSAEIQGEGNAVVGSGAKNNAIGEGNVDLTISGSGNKGGSIVINSLDASVAEAALNSNQVNTALAFSTIDNITAANALGAEQADNESAAQLLVAAQGVGSVPPSMGATPQTFQNTPTTIQGGLPGSGSSLNNFSIVIGIIAAVVGLYYYTSKNK
jgi:hypothetical protein